MSEASIEQELQALRLRVRHMEDIEDIQRLRMRYHYFINEGYDVHRSRERGLTG